MYVKHLMDSTKIEQNTGLSKISKVPRYKINIQKSLVFLYKNVNFEIKKIFIKKYIYNWHFSLKMSTKETTILDGFIGEVYQIFKRVIASNIFDIKKVKIEILFNSFYQASIILTTKSDRYSHKRNYTVGGNVNWYNYHGKR